MTSEVVVMNRLAVALAADSASTVQGPSSQKIWNSANKLFALSKCRPVGVMVYNNASILGVPWETVIKSYRAENSTVSFGRLEEYGSNFLAFLNRSTLLFPRDVQEKYFLRQVSRKYQELRELARREHISAILSQASTTEEQHFEKAVLDELVEWNSASDLTTSSDHVRDTLAGQLGAAIDATIQEQTQGISVSADVRAQLLEIAILMITKDRFDDDYTGIVFAGFGEAEHFPVLQHFRVGLVVLDQLKHSSPDVAAISDSMPALVRPFAQSEMVDTFLQGINPKLRAELTRSFIGLALGLPETVIDSITDLTVEQRANWKAQTEPAAKVAISDLLKKLAQLGVEKHWAPVVHALVHLPKDELAHVAESLVNLNSFQKRVSMEDETVGGPIDVAVISKGDGLIWIKRKHYFSRDLNEHYFINLQTERGHGQ